MRTKSHDRKLFVGIVVIPAILAIVYYTLFAVDRYVSDAQIVVRQSGGTEQSASTSGLALLLTGVNPASREETLYLRQYVSSLDMLKILENELDWKNHYVANRTDPLYWLSATASDEDMLKFYNRVVETHFDEVTGLLTISVQGFAADFSNQVVRVIQRESERFVNEISHAMARDQLKFTETELANSRRRFLEAQDALISFQAKNQILDAQEYARGKAEAIAAVEVEISNESARLSALRATLGPQTTQVRQQQNKLRSLHEQLEGLRKELLAESGGQQLNVVASKYRDLTINATIAEESYKLNVAALENVRIESSKKIRTLVTIVSPHVAQSPVLPRTAYNLLTIFICLLLLFGVIKFVVTAIQDHKD